MGLQTVKHVADGASGTGGIAAFVSGWRFLDHPEILPYIGMIGGLIIGLLGIVVSASISIYYNRQQIKIIKGRRYEDSPLPEQEPLTGDDRPDWLPDPPPGQPADIPTPPPPIDLNE